MACQTRSWYDTASTGSTISYSISATEICAQGTGAQVIDRQWGEYWGASIGFGVCETGADEDPPNTAYTLGTCPWTEGLENQIYGIRFQINGNHTPYDIESVLSVLAEFKKQAG